jgi:hypothetical protein
MVTEIRIYVEGGGDGKETRARVRQGFSGFLKDLVALARERRIRWSITACGSRNSTLDDFLTALQTHPEAFSVLLVDSEGPVSAGPRQHLKDRDGWDLSKIPDEQCHMMVQVMEAWLIADIAALKRYYGHRFNSKSAPGTRDVEQVDKKKVYSFLKAATRKTTKGEYHKIHHGPELLKQVDASMVRRASRHCDRLFQALEQEILSS